MQAIGCLLFILLIAFVFFLSVVGSVASAIGRMVNWLFGFGQRPAARQEESAPPRKEPEREHKVFSQEEREYVDFEEITDTDE